MTLALLPANSTGLHYSEDEKAAKFDVVLRHIGEGKTRTLACKLAGIAGTTLVEWIVKDESMGLRYARARAEQAHVYADEALDIADESTDTIEGVQRNRLRVDTRKWLASKLLPRIYGEKVTAEHTHRVGVVMLPAIARDLESPAHSLNPAAQVSAG